MRGPVIVVGQNSVLQKTCTIGRLVRGEVNRIESQYVSASGKGMNVASVLSALDVPAVLYGYAGGENGRRFIAGCEERDIETNITRIQSETRQCMTIIEPDGTTTEIVEPSPGVTERESRAFLESVLSAIPQAALVCICGTAVREEPEDTYGSIVREARAAGVPVILDAHRVHGLRALDESPDILKINESELAAVYTALHAESSPSPAATRQDRELMARTIMDKYGVHTIVVTRGRHGAEAYATHGWATAASSITEIENPIGCGDAFTAAIAHRMTQDGESGDTSPPLAGILRHGVTIATAHGLSMQPGDLQLSHISRVAPTILVSGSEGGGG